MVNTGGAVWIVVPAVTLGTPVRELRLARAAHIVVAVAHSLSETVLLITSVRYLKNIAAFIGIFEQRIDCEPVPDMFRAQAVPGIVALVIPKLGECFMVYVGSVCRGRPR